MRPAWIIAALLSALGTTVYADDLVAPPWERYVPGTEFYQWGFDEDSWYLWPPDEGAFGAGAQFFDYSLQGSWAPAREGRSGVFVGGGIAMIQLAGDAYTDFYLQTVSCGPGYMPTVELGGYGSGEWSIDLTHDVELDGTAWHYLRYHMHVSVPPNPEWGPWWINLYLWDSPEEACMIDQLILDSIPEPGPAVLLAVLGALATARRHVRGKPC